MGIDEHFDAMKQHWARNFAFLDNFKKLKALRESGKFTLGGALVGAAHLGSVAFKYSKSLHGVVLATRFGAFTGAVLRLEVAEHWYQFYKMDKQGGNLRFIYWWEDKVSGQKS